MILMHITTSSLEGKIKEVETYFEKYEDYSFDLFKAKVEEIRSELAPNELYPEEKLRSYYRRGHLKIGDQVISVSETDFDPKFGPFSGTESLNLVISSSRTGSALVLAAVPNTQKGREYLDFQLIGLDESKDDTTHSRILVGTLEWHISNMS